MASSTWRRIHATIRWIPFVFIAAMIAFAFIVLVDLHVSYTFLRRGWYVSSVINIGVACALAGLALWSFVVSVFKSPGYPPGVLPNVQHSATAGVHSSESRWERHHRLREEQIGLADDDDAAETEEAEEDHYDEDNQFGDGHSWSGERRSQEAPLLSSQATTPRHRASRADPSTNVFDAGAVPLPGQPKMPARTGRAQLNDVVAVVEQAKQERLDGRVFLGGLQVKNTGGRRWCKQCNCQKPDRAHHCSTCGLCVLRMDHHCPWLASKCIGLRNHKAFFLFLFYTALFCCYAAQDTGRALIRYVEDEANGYQTTPITWAIILFLGLIFGLALMPFSAYHAYLICRNRTTLENMEGAGRVRIAIPRGDDAQPPRENVSDRLQRLARSSLDNRRPVPARTRRNDDNDTWKRDEELTREERKTLRKANKLNIYDLGAARNWRSVMGERWAMWWIPIGDPESDGMRYEVNPQTLRQLEDITMSIRDMQRTGDGRHETEREANARIGDDRHDALDNDRTTTPPPQIDTRTSNVASAFSPPVSSIRSKARPSSTTNPDLSTTIAASTTGISTANKANASHKTGHGIATWGAPPKRDFVLYGLADDEDDVNSGGVLTHNDARRSRRTSGRPVRQMDADVWS